MFVDVDRPGWYSPEKDCFCCTRTSHITPTSHITTKNVSLGVSLSHFWHFAMSGFLVFSAISIGANYELKQLEFDWMNVIGNVNSFAESLSFCKAVMYKDVLWITPK